MTVDNLPARAGAISFKGQPMTLLGPELRAGDPAPDFALTAGDLSTVTPRELLDDGQRAALLIVVPSLDTSVCSLESHKFNHRLGELPAGVKAWVVSMDLPFAQARWATTEGDVELGMLSDYRSRNFGPNYGLLISELGLLARAVIVIGKDGRIAYVQLVPEVTNEPDYDAAIAAATAAA